MVPVATGTVSRHPQGPASLSIPTSTARRYGSSPDLDQQLAEAVGRRVAPEIADPLGALESAEHESVEKLGPSRRRQRLKTTLSAPSISSKATRWTLVPPSDPSRKALTPRTSTISMRRSYLRTGHRSTSTSCPVTRSVTSSSDEGLTRGFRSEVRPSDLRISSVEVRGFEPLTPAVRRHIGRGCLPAETSPDLREHATQYRHK
jgi:hypothetical protein